MPKPSQCCVLLWLLEYQTMNRVQRPNGGHFQNVLWKISYVSLVRYEMMHFVFVHDVKWSRLYKCVHGIFWSFRKILSQPVGRCVKGARTVNVPVFTPPWPASLFMKF
jgi:hypothetical protein